MALTFVPTPLGNLRDVTLRALDVLREATLIVAEDTRVTRRLLSAYEITGKALWTYHEHNAASTTEAILARARDEAVALVTDAGMPGISDPGSALVTAAREAGIAVEVLPGPSAFVCAAVLSGFALDRFSFEGFVPRSAGARREALGAALRAGAPSIWYEAPHRIVATLEAIGEIDPQAPLFFVREFTKLHEQRVAGTAAELLASLERPVRGEIALVVRGRPPVRRGRDDDASGNADASGAEATGDGAPIDVDAEIDALLDAGTAVAEIAKALARRGAGERRELYTHAAARKRGRGDATDLA